MIRRVDDIEAWLVRLLAERLNTSSESIDPCEPFASYGLTSRDAVVLSGELEEWLGRTLSQTLVWDHPTIRELARFLAEGAALTRPAQCDVAAGTNVDPIAIVGIGCRFPGAPDPDAFWNLLRSGGDAIREVPADRWDVAAFYDPDPATPGRTVTRFGGFLPRIDEFEPSFFCISPREASHMDPQQRLLLEVTWEALENAGIAPPSLYGTDTGVFVGISTSDYGGLQLSDPARVVAHDGTGSAHSIAANRLSYLLDLRGPSLAVDSACSSSLVAVHFACQRLPEDAVEIGQAPLWGFGRTLALEHPELWGGLTDLDDRPARSLAVALADELLGEAGEDQVAYRKGLRYVARLEPCPDRAAHRAPLRGDAAYLVTGGLGGIGLALSRWLVDRGARHLVLTGRTAGAATRTQRECVAELERRGASVRLAQVDASDEPGMAALLDELRRDALPLRGVFHAAGISAPRTIAELDAAALEGVLAPEVAGAWILHRLTREMELDHFVCFSSISSILGSRRLAGYAAGNAFLDALAQHRAALGLPALSVNWGPWAEVGMTPPAEQAALERIGMYALPTRDALAILDHVLDSDVSQVMAARIDWSAFAPALEARAPRPLLADVRIQAASTPPDEPELRRRLADAPLDARLALVLDWLRSEVARVLGRDTPAAIDLEQGFFEMGLDSLMAVELKRRLERATGLSLPRTIAFEFPNVEALARHLCAACACPPASTASTPTPTPEPPALPEREVEALLLDELRSMEQEMHV